MCEGPGRAWRSDFCWKTISLLRTKKENLMYTKTELHEGTRVVLSAMQYLEKMYGPASGAEIDMRPWVSGDHPI